MTHEARTFPALWGMTMLLKYLPPKGSRNNSIRDVLHAAWPTAATPSTFATPVDLHEDDSSFTLFFDIGARTAATIEVKVSGSAIFVLGETSSNPAFPAFPRATRVFLLYSMIDALGISTRFEEPGLIVRIPKTTAGRRTIVVRQGE